MTNLNIFQAALSLRTSGQEGLFLEASPSQLVNTYLILHDALHVYLDIPADTTENELQINCAEEVLANNVQSWTAAEASAMRARLVASVPADQLAILEYFFTHEFVRG